MSGVDDTQMWDMWELCGVRKGLVSALVWSELKGIDQVQVGRGCCCFSVADETGGKERCERGSREKDSGRSRAGCRVGGEACETRRVSLTTEK